MIERAFSSVLTADIARAKDWYIDLFGFEVEFDSDWFVHLRSPDVPAIEVGLIARDHQIVAERMRPAPVGGLLTFVVDDVDREHRHALERGLDIVEPPTDLFYGQRRMLLADPDGQVVDVSSECPPDPDWLASLG